LNGDKAQDSQAGEPFGILAAGITHQHDRGVGFNSVRDRRDFAAPITPCWIVHSISDRPQQGIDHFANWRRRREHDQRRDRN